MYLGIPLLNNESVRELYIKLIKRAQIIGLKSVSDSIIDVTDIIILNTNEGLGKKIYKKYSENEVATSSLQIPYSTNFYYGDTLSGELFFVNINEPKLDK